MTDKLIHHIASLRQLTPDEEFVDTLKKRVMMATKQSPIEHIHMAPEPSPIQPARFMSPLNGLMATLASGALVLCLVVANQAPMGSAYTQSIADVATASELAEKFETAADVSSAAAGLHAVTARTRATLDSLKLMGAPGLYTREQCQQAYIIYDRYLDTLGKAVDEKIRITKSDSDVRILRGLRDYIDESAAEAQSRLALYPQS